MDSLFDTPDDVIAYYQPDSTLRIVVNRPLSAEQQRRLKRQIEAMKGVESCKLDQGQDSVGFSISFRANAAPRIEALRQDIRAFAIEYLRIAGVQKPLF